MDDWKNIFDNPPPKNEILWGYDIQHGRIEFVEWDNGRDGFMPWPYNDSDSDHWFMFWMPAEFPDGPPQAEIDRIFKLREERQ